MEYLLNCKSFIFLMVLFSFFDNFGMDKGETDEDYDHLLNKDNDYNYLFKVVFVGDAGVGKTQIINKFVKNKFSNDYNPTIGLDFYFKTINSNEKIIKLQLWDSSGQEKFRTMIQNFYKNVHLIVFVYAVDDKNTFENIKNWVKNVKEQTDEKIDLILDKMDANSPKLLTEQIFATGCVWDAWSYVSDLVRSAKQRIVLIDNFVDDRVLSLLDKRGDGVEAMIHSRYSESFLTDLQKHNAQQREIKFTQLPYRNHDRFLIIDDEVYLLGASVKDMGVGLCAITKMRTTPETVLGLLG